MGRANLLAMKPVRVPDLRAMKVQGTKITVLTAYDAGMARLLDRAGLDVILVGDSVGMVVLGYDTTIPVTLDMMVHHTQAVSRGVQRALVVADLPFLTYQLGIEDAMRNAGRLIQQGGASAVKLEGGTRVAGVVQRLNGSGIPVIGHLGLTPQSVHSLGGFRQQARDEASAAALLADAQALQEAGAFAIVLESIPAALAKRVSASLEIPTIGIGAGPDCDGQVLVLHDLLGLFDRFTPKFVKQYANLKEQALKAIQEYKLEVETGVFPSQDQSFK
jgi:3-methyl-2-oxobutanoate hydroxymethyltransferase